MARKKKKTRTPGSDPWEEAKVRYRLTARHVQMARKLGLNPRNFQNYAPSAQERWKQPLPQFIERLYREKYENALPEHELRRFRQRLDEQVHVAQQARTRGDPRTAAEILRDAAGIASEAGQHKSAARCWSESAELLEGIEDLRAARNAYRKALVALQSAGDDRGAQRVQKRLAKLDE